MTIDKDIKDGIRRYKRIAGNYNMNFIVKIGVSLYN